MNKDAILKTAILKQQEGKFTVLSPLCDALIGVGETREQAVLRFKTLVQDRYIAYVEGRLAGSQGKVGRPKKNCVEFHTQLKPEVKRDIVDMARELNLSQGDIIEFLYRCYLQQKELLETPKELCTT